MAVEGNGKVSDPVQKGINAHAVVPRSRKIEPRSTLFSRLLSVVARLLIWYSIFTILFRCPSVELLDTSSPKVCKPYFQAKSIITPHVTPYYDTYAAPYVDSARPYYQVLDKMVIAPVIVYGKKYAAPRVAQAQAFGQAQWERSVQPQVSKFTVAAQQQYGQTLGPHVDQAWALANPYYMIAKDSAVQTYYTTVLPTYSALQPYAHQAYSMGNEFAVNTGIPYAKWAWTAGIVFLERTVWPKIRVLYGENVEPQLVRIGERLGRYRDGKKLQAAVDEVDFTSSSIAPPSAFSTDSSSIATPHATESISTAVEETISDVSSSEAPASTPLSEEEQRANAQKIVSEDLKTWQEKFAKAADKGSEELDQRVTDITARFVQSQAQGVGEAHLVQLEETVSSSIKALKKDIQSIAKNPSDTETSESQLTTAVRKAGLAIKEKAQAVRSWRQRYDQETNYLVTKAADETFEIIDHIRDLGLQEIGMRWAWTDGITHKDWTKYHNLKTKFDEWRKDVEDVATSHPGLAKARAASEDIESRAMAIVEDAVKELGDLKETGRWKISTSDDSDDFSTKLMPAAAANAGQKILNKVYEATEALVGTSTGSVESLSSIASSKIAEATEWASSVGENASASIIGSSDSAANAVASPLSDTASSVIIGTSIDPIESLGTVASSAVAGISEPAAVVSESAPSLSGILSSALSSSSSIYSESLPSVSESAGSSASSLSSQKLEGASSVSEEVNSASSSASSTSSKKVWGGAMAQKAEERTMIYEDVIEDDSTYGERIQSMASEAGEKFSDMTKAVSEALLRPTATQGSVESLTRLGSEQYSKALSAASVALYGVPQGTGASIASVASSRYADAVAAASAVIYGTAVPAANSVLFGPPLAAMSSISAVAASKLSEGLSIASAQYSTAKIALGATPAPTGYLVQAQNQYYAGIGLAHARYSEFMEAASIAVMPTPTPLYESYYSRASAGIIGTQTGAVESAISAAQSQYSEAIAVASKNMDGILSSISKVANEAVPTENIASLASSRYNVAVSAASEAYASASLAASSVAFGTATGSLESIESMVSGSVESAASLASNVLYGSEPAWRDSAASAASENWEALVTRASIQIYGAPTPVYESLFSQAGEYTSQATEAAAVQYQVIQSLISELVVGREPEFIDSIYARFSSAYYTDADAAVSSASSFASEAYASASSVVGSVFTPPPILEAVLDNASSHLGDVVKAASIHLYGTTKGTYEQATSSVASAYSSMTSAASVAAYGSQTGYAEAASSSIADAAASAHSAILEAIYGTSTPAYASATSVVAENLSAATSVVGDAYSAATAKVSSLIHGPEQGAVESAQARLNVAVESARAKLAEFAAAVGEGADSAISAASSGVEEFVSSVSSVVASPSAKDEL